MRNQKNKINTLETENENQAEKIRTLNSEIVHFKNQIAKQQAEYTKIGIVIERGIEVQSKKLAELINESLEKKTLPKGQKEKMQSELKVYGDHINNMISWYQSVYGNNPPETSTFEIIELTQSVIHDVTNAFKYKKITFINHIGEPLHISADHNMISYAISTIATMMALRSVTGNTMYVDVERTGKKCMVTFEDSGPGDKDNLIKDISGEKYEEQRIQELSDFNYISFILAKDLIESNGGKVWVSSIMEVGIKISFSLPLE